MTREERDRARGVREARRGTLTFTEHDSRDAFVFAGVLGFVAALLGTGVAHGLRGTTPPDVWADVCALGVGAVVFAVVLGLGLAASVGRRQRLLSQYKAVRGDVKSGGVETARFQPLEVLRVGFVETADGDGNEIDVPVYYFRTGRSEAVCLAEFSVTSSEDAATGFPNSDIELVRLPGSGVLLTVTCHGEKMEPVEEVNLPIREIGDRLDTVFECDFEKLKKGGV